MPSLVSEAPPALPAGYTLVPTPPGHDGSPRVHAFKVAFGRIENGWKHRFVDLLITGLTEDQPAVTVDVGFLQVVRVFHVTPQPVGFHGSVVWDGDEGTPGFAFDGFPADGPVRIRVEVWGA